MLIQGEIISNSYWDAMAEEINERLHECSQIAVAELACCTVTSGFRGNAFLKDGSQQTIPFLNTWLNIKFDVGFCGFASMCGVMACKSKVYLKVDNCILLLDYVARVNAMVRGVSRGIIVPTNLSALCSELFCL